MTASGVSLSGSKLYHKLQRYILPEDKLEVNCYPRPVAGESGRARIRPHQSAVLAAERGDTRCRRCEQPFDATYSRQETCRYHWGKCFAKPGTRKMYECCRGGPNSGPCETARNHVHGLNIVRDTSGYVQTGPSEGENDKSDYGIFSLDCEMIFTKKGMQLARITVIDDKNKVVYESMVKPSHDIIDYHTRFSGIYATDMDDVTTTIEEVQEKLLSMFSEETILLGHGLDSDLAHLKLLHDKVVDTSVVFPHHKGPPYKKSLKQLAEDILGRQIRRNGHDSKEDAQCCLDLMKWKIV